jgi:hypothetical protein
MQEKFYVVCIISLPSLLRPGLRVFQQKSSSSSFIKHSNVSGLMVFPSFSDRISRRCALIQEAN